jgi:DNA-binding CsgD family transcriptional regulator
MILRNADFAMSEIERFSALVGDIYDASLDPAQWSAVFEKACAFIGGSAAHLISHSAVGKTADFYFAANQDPKYIQLYFDKYFRINPIFPAVIFFDVEETHCVPDILPREEFCRTRFFQEFLLPQGYMDGLFANMEKSATGCALFTVFRRMSDGLVDDEMRRRFALVVPHVRRALLIGKVIDLKKVEAAVLADSLDTLVSAMFLVDGAGRIVHANASGHIMVAEANVVRAPNSRLGATDPAADRALLESFTASSGGDAALGRRGIAVPLRARNGERYVANVLPLTSGARRRAGVSYAAVATVFIHKAALDLPSPPEAVAQEFRLTPAELRVLFAVIEVGGVADVAAVLGLSEATVKTHLQRLFQKTGSARQADLVKLVAGYSIALVG